MNLPVLFIRFKYNVLFSVRIPQKPHTYYWKTHPILKAPPEMQIHFWTGKENSTKSAAAQSFVCVISTQPPAKTTFLQRPELSLWWRSVEKTEVFTYIALCFLFCVWQDLLRAPRTDFFQNILFKKKNKGVYVSCISSSLAVTQPAIITGW